jgi:pyruvate dehydrogenase E2 component (dihydrolipoamide acetyltransferase)
MDVLMPQLGETVAEGKISTWFKAVGDEIKPGDNLFEIETDKVSMEVPAIAAGVLAEIRVPEGAIAPVGAIVAVISDRAGARALAASSAAPPKAAMPPAKASGPAVAVDQPRSTLRPVTLDPFHEVRTPERNYGPARLPSGTVTTPLARRLAGQSGIDLSGLKGSGPHGRIVARDVEAAITMQPAMPAVRAAPAVGVPPDARPTAAEQIKALYRDTPFAEVPLDAMRRTIAARLTEAQAVPHFTLTMDLAVEKLLALRQEANAAAEGKGGAAFKLSVNDFVIKALALALQRVPAANAVWAEDCILRFTHSDIGVAVALEGGLLTPVIRQAETKSLTVISAEMADLAARARARKLMVHEYQGGSTAISNLGMRGIRAFSAIINPPHATILAVGATERRPVENPDGSVRFADQMTVTLCCDHRVVDGALGAELLGALKGLMENPVSMLI